MDDSERLRVERVARIFGTVLPDTTADDGADEPATDGRDDWYRENRPPHHDERS